MHTIYWAAVHNQNKRQAYFELEDLGDGQWGVLLDDDEFTIHQDSPDFWDVLSTALAERSARQLAAPSASA